MTTQFKSHSLRKTKKLQGILTSRFVCKVAAVALAFFFFFQTDHSPCSDFPEKYCATVSVSYISICLQHLPCFGHLIPVCHCFFFSCLLCWCAFSNQSLLRFFSLGFQGTALQKSIGTSHLHGDEEVLWKANKTALVGTTVTSFSPVIILSQMKEEERQLGSITRAWGQ